MANFDQRYHFNKYISGKSIGALAVAVAVAAAAFTVGDAMAQAKKRGGTLTVALDNNLRGFDLTQIRSVGSGGRAVLSQIHDNLFLSDKQGNLIPRLGLSIKSSDDFKIWRIKLRKGVKYSNGEPFNAETYVVGVQRLLDSKRRDSLLGQTAPFEKVIAIDDHTVEFRLSRSYPAFRSMVSLPHDSFWFQAPKHTKKVGKGIMRNPVGAGPYMLADWKPGNSITFVRNPHYWDKENGQHLEKIVWKVIKDRRATINTLKTGGVDMFITRHGPTAKKASKDSDTTDTSFNAGSTQSIWFNWKLPALRELKVRQALAYAVDRNVVKKVADAHAILSNDYFGPESQWYCHETKNMYPKYDPEKAKRLLKEYGKPVKFTLLTENRGMRLKIAQVHQTFWERVGVEVELKAIQRGAAFQKALRKGEYQVVNSPLAARIDPALVNREIHSKHSGNTMGLNIPEIDAAFDAADAVIDPKKRRAAYCKVNALAIKHLTQLLVFHVPGHAVHKNFVKGVRLAGANITMIPEIWLDK